MTIKTNYRLTLVHTWCALRNIKIQLHTHGLQQEVRKHFVKKHSIKVKDMYTDNIYKVIYVIF